MSRKKISVPELCLNKLKFSNSNLLESPIPEFLTPNTPFTNIPTFIKGSSSFTVEDMRYMLKYNNYSEGDLDLNYLENVKIIVFKFKEVAKNKQFVFGRLRDLKIEFDSKDETRTPLFFAWIYRSEDKFTDTEKEDRMLNIQLILYSIALGRSKILKEDIHGHNIFLRSQSQVFGYQNKCYTDMEFYVHQRLHDIHHIKKNAETKSTTPDFEINSNTLSFIFAKNKKELLKKIEKEYKFLGIPLDISKDRINFDEWIIRMTEKLYKEYEVLYLKQNDKSKEKTSKRKRAVSADCASSLTSGDINIQDIDYVNRVFSIAESPTPKRKRTVSNPDMGKSLYL